MYNLIYERLARPVGRLVCHGQEMCKWSISLCDAMGAEIDSIFFVYTFLIEKVDILRICRNLCIYELLARRVDQSKGSISSVHTMFY